MTTNPVVTLKRVTGCRIRFTKLDALQTAWELEDRGWSLRNAGGQLMVNTGGAAMPAELRDRVKAQKRELLRLLEYCEAVP